MKLKDKKIELVAFTSTINENGYPVTVETTIARVWAYFRQLSGKEAFAAATINYKEEVLFTINYRTDITIRYNKLRKFQNRRIENSPQKQGTRSASSGRMKLRDKHSKGDADHVRENCNTERGSNQGGNPGTCTRERGRNAE